MLPVTDLKEKLFIRSRNPYANGNGMERDKTQKHGTVDGFLHYNNVPTTYITVGIMQFHAHGLGSTLGRLQRA